MRYIKKGVTQSDLQRALPSSSVESIAEKINELLKGVSSLLQNSKFNSLTSRRF